MKTLIFSLIAILMSSCSCCHSRDNNCVCDSDCYKTQPKDGEHCGCEKTCGCR